MPAAKVSKIGTCEECNERFESRTHNKRFCSNLCQGRNEAKRPEARERKKQQRLKYYYSKPDHYRVRHREWYQKNIDRLRVYHRDRAKREREQRPAKYKHWSLKREFGISLTQYSERFWLQDGKCAICREPPMKRQYLSVDHDHKTGAIRALLCSLCNSMLGFARDNPGLLEKAAYYVRFFNGISHM